MGPTPPRVVVGFILPPERLHPALAELSRHLEKVGNEAGQTLSVANAAWLNTTLKVQPEYLKLMGDYYSNEMRQLDFCQGPWAQKTINDWVGPKRPGTTLRTSSLPLSHPGPGDRFHSLLGPSVQPP